MKFALESTIVFGSLFANRFVASEDIGGGGDHGGGASIIGGAPATTGDFFVEGYATMLRKSDSYGGCCGAHLIAPDLLLTAAHVSPQNRATHS